MSFPSSNIFSGRIIFDHLPKTAGQAINAWLKDALGTGSVTENLIGEHQELIRKYGGMYSIISGHITFFPGEGLDPRYKYITFFRDPVDRAISWIFYLLYNVPIERARELVTGAQLFLDSNGDKATPEFIKSVTNPYTSHFFSIATNESFSEEEKIDIAFDVIKNYSVVGIYERMPEFLIETSSLIGIKPPSLIERVNVTAKRPGVNEIPETLRNKISELNQMDLKLYAKIFTWKNQQYDKEKPAERPESCWDKYERKSIERNVTTAELSLISLSLREGPEIRHGQIMTFDLEFCTAKEIEDLETGIHIFDSEKNWAFGVNNTLLKHRHQKINTGSFRVTYHVIANLPAGRYTAGFACTQKPAVGEPKELFWRDLLCEFNVVHATDNQFVGYCNLPTQINVAPTRLMLPEREILDAQGKLHVINAPTSLRVGENVQLMVQITNRSAQAWLGDTLRPVSLSYHWLHNNGETAYFEGLRTPVEGIYPAEEMQASIKIETPCVAGNYILMLTMVQDGVRWFEEMGFEPEKLEIAITE